MIGVTLFSLSDDRRFYVANGRQLRLTQLCLLLFVRLMGLIACLQQNLLFIGALVNLCNVSLTLIAAGSDLSLQ